MHAISGPAQSAAIAQLLTNAPVVPTRRIPPSDQRTPPQRSDSYTPSSPADTLQQVTYGRNGQGGGGDVDRDGDSA